MSASCGKENDLHPLYSSPTDSSLYYTMLGDHAWLGIYDPDNQSFTETWANSFVRFTSDSVIFSHMVLTFSDTWDSTWYEARPVVAHAYTFRPPDTYFFDSIRYVVDAYPQHGCVYFWGEDGYAYSVAKERTQLSNKTNPPLFLPNPHRTTHPVAPARTTPLGDDQSGKEVESERVKK